METEPSKDTSSSAHEHPPAECLEMFRHLSEYIDQELDTVASHTIEQHLKDCPACRICLATLRQTVSLCRSMHASSIEITETASEKLHQAIRKYVETTQ
ncbi:MAG: zf-HC2 domain-containing protein [Thermodesulfobacteriota bacterium]